MRCNSSICRTLPRTNGSLILSRLLSGPSAVILDAVESIISRTMVTGFGGRVLDIVMHVAYGRSRPARNYWSCKPCEGHSSLVLGSLPQSRLNLTGMSAYELQ